MHLLQDDNGAAVDLIINDHFKDGGAAIVTKVIIQKWLKSDKTPCTYQYLIECLRQSELGTLAKVIEESITS